MKIESAVPFRFRWDIEMFDPNGELLSRMTQLNLVPGEALNYILNSSFRGAAQLPAWYVALYQGNYTPTGTETAATLPSAATECTTYTAATRPAWTTVASTAGALTNAASRAEFVSNSTQTLYGGFLSSASGKGATTGTLGSVVRFGASQVFTAGNTLRITAGIVLTSV